MLTLAITWFSGPACFDQKAVSMALFLSKGKLSQYAINVVSLISGPWLQHQLIEGNIKKTAPKCSFPGPCVYIASFQSQFRDNRLNKDSIFMKPTEKGYSGPRREVAAYREEVETLCAPAACISPICVHNRKREFLSFNQAANVDQH